MPLLCYQNVHCISEHTSPVPSHCSQALEGGVAAGPLSPGSMPSSVALMAQCKASLALSMLLLVKVREGRPAEQTHVPLSTLLAACCSVSAHLTPILAVLLCSSCCRPLLATGVPQDGLQHQQRAHRGLCGGGREEAGRGGAAVAVAAAAAEHLRAPALLPGACCSCSAARVAGRS